MNKWETKSLEWLHNVREKIDKEIRKKGLTLSDWVKSRKIDVSSMCKKMGLEKIKIIQMPINRKIISSL